MIEHRNEKGELHRVDGPAVEDKNGYQAWWVDGKLHCVDGPAVVRADGYCVDGPGVVRSDGYREWWVDGKFIKSERAKEKEE